MAALALWRTTGFDTQYRTPDVAKTLGKYLSCAERADHGKDFELILTVKAETRHLVESQFGSEYPAISHHCKVMAAWSRKTWKFCKQFLHFLRKTTPYGKIFKILFGKFSPSHRLTFLCRNFVKFIQREIGEIVRYLLDKKFRLHLKTVATARIARTICQGQPPTSCNTVLQISSKSVHFRRSNSRTRKHRFCPIEYFHNSPEAMLALGGE